MTAIPPEAIEAAGVVLRDHDNCGMSVDDKTVFCDDPRLPDDLRFDQCACKRQGEAALAAAMPYLLHTEREACAQIADHHYRTSEWVDGRIEAEQIARAIRARNEPPKTGVGG